MRFTRRAALLAATALTLTATPALATGASSPPVDPAASVQPWLAGQLADRTADGPLRVAVRGTSTDAALAAVAAAGLTVQQRWERVDTVVALGSVEQVRAVTGREGVVRVDGDQPMSYLLDTAHVATRSAQAATSYPGATGEGVSVAVIDSGIDGTHPFFQRDGRSKVVRNLKNACGIVLSDEDNETCFQDVPTNDTDTISGGGHGTHVAGIVAGVPVTTTAPEGTTLRGAAPGASLVGLSVGAAIGLLDAASAQYWVLEHHRSPCAAADAQSDVPDPACPPIRATNHSYGPIATEGEDQQFDAEAVSVQIQRQLVGEGVAAVWAAGNDGGDGSYAATNPDAMDPTPGVLMVASYDDGQSGDRDNQLSTFSSRGKDGSPGTFPDLAAPGDLITSACRPTLAVCQGAPSYDGGDYQTISGTSMASPYVAGVVAQLLALDPARTPGQAEDLLEDTAHPFVFGADYVADPLNPTTPTSFDKGHGLVDVLAALATAQGDVAPVATPAAALAPRCDGTDLVLDPAGDAASPVVGAPAPAQDVTGISFAADATTLTVTAGIADLSQLPAPGTTGTTYYVPWTGPDGRSFAVEHVAPAGSFTVGQFDPTTGDFVAGTTSSVSGTRSEGADGSISWAVPRAAVGSPTVPVDLTTDPAAVPAVRDAYAVVFGNIGFAGTGLTFTAPVDRAPDGGAVPAWSVCNSAPTAGKAKPAKPGKGPKGPKGA